MGLSPYRLNLLRGLHASARDAGLNEDMRRNLQVIVTDKSSCKDMTDTELALVRDAIKEELQPSKQAKPHEADEDPLKRKIFALWWDLGNRGGIPDWAAMTRIQRKRMLDGYIQKGCAVERMEWLIPEQCNRVIEGLKARIERVENA